MTTRHLLLLAACALLPLSCSTTSDVSPSQARAAARNSITVVAPRNKPMMRIIGTTVFNNEFEEIDDPGYSFPDHLVGVLRSKGYNAKIGTKKSPGTKIVLSPTYPHGDQFMIGEGIYWRSILRMGGGFSAHCNYRASLIDKSTGLRKGQPIDWAGKGYFIKPTSVKRAIDDWAELTASEKSILKSALRTQMDASARHITTQLGL